jgi:hypothetical protein
VQVPRDGDADFSKRGEPLSLRLEPQTVDPIDELKRLIRDQG